MKKENSKEGPSGDGGNFLSTPQTNGAYVDKSRGSGLGTEAKNIIGTESVADPLKSGK